MPKSYLFFFENSFSVLFHFAMNVDHEAACKHTVDFRHGFSRHIRKRLAATVLTPAFAQPQWQIIVSFLLPRHVNSCWPSCGEHASGRCIWASVVMASVWLLAIRSAAATVFRHNANVTTVSDGLCRHVGQTSWDLN
jgi:hypothetical protein